MKKLLLISYGLAIAAAVEAQIIPNTIDQMNLNPLKIGGNQNYVIIDEGKLHSEIINCSPTEIGASSMIRSNLLEY